MYRPSIVLLMAAIITTTSAHGAESSSSYDGAWEELLAMNLTELADIKVTSASKRPQTLSEAPSPVYVFTEEDIKRTGVRNIMELIRFIPGFYIYPRIDQRFVISNRGIRSSSNDKILFLLDGMPINNSSKSGAVNADIFPGLDKVKRVEVISGPGSTMWGSDASFGIISIITKDGKDIKGNSLSVNVASVDNHFELNYLSGQEFSSGEYMLSLTFARNSGFGYEENGFLNSVQDFDTVVWNDQHGKFNHLYPSYEILGKIRIGDFTLKAIASEKSLHGFWGTTISGFNTKADARDEQSLMTSQDMHLEFSHHSELSDTATLDTKLTAKQIRYIRGELIDSGPNHGTAYNASNPPFHRSERYPENGFGLEFLLNWDINEQHTLTAGTRLRVVNAGPGSVEHVNLYDGKESTDTTARKVNLYYRTADTTLGVYAEDTYRATSNLTLVGGLRVDYNNPREKVSVVSPRAAAIYRFNDNLTGKYMYNTGYVRPLIAKSFEVAIDRDNSVKESEKIRAHDIALIYNSGSTQLTAGAYQMTIIDRNSYDAFLNEHVDDGDLSTQGVELAVRHGFAEGKVLLNFNYGYATAETKNTDGTIESYFEGIPNHVYAAGIDYKISPRTSLYTSVSGWRDLKMDNVEATSWISSPAHPDYDGDHLVDINLRFADLLNKSLDISVYVLNVLDRKARLQAKDDWHAWWSYARERSIGARASLRF